MVRMGLTTAMLLIEALSRHLGEDEVFDGFSGMKLRNYYLLNPYESGEKGFKLLLTETDKDSLLALIKQRPMPENYSLLKRNFTFFDEQIAKLGDDLIPLCRGLAKLLIVDVALNRGQDNPQLIFESMNSTGKALSQADLVRNFIRWASNQSIKPGCMKITGVQWKSPLVSKVTANIFAEFDASLSDGKNGEIPRTDEVYEAFKLHALTSSVAEKGVDRLVEDIDIYAEYYCAMALGKESDKSLATAFQDLRELKVDVAYPFLLALYHDYKNGVLSRGFPEHNSFN